MHWWGGQLRQASGVLRTAKGRTLLVCCLSTEASTHSISSLSSLSPLRPYLQGLFERHKLLVATQLCMRILQKQGELSHEKFEYLLRGPKVIRGCLGVQ